MMYRPKMASLRHQEEQNTLQNIADLMEMGHVSLARELLLDFADDKFWEREKAQRDAARDRNARTLIGARLPRETAERVRAAAAAAGKSVYRWTRDTIEKELDGVPF